MYRKFRKIHFVGIGGIGMSGIAEVLKNLGYEVSGSDIKESDTTRRLRDLGIDVSIGHRSENVRDADVVVVSSAIRDDNPEVRAAREGALPVIPRAEMLAEIARLKYAILVAGAHGKTTTTSLIASVLGECGMDPTAVIGGKLKSIGSNARLGEGEFLVAEADESDGSFLMLSPTIAVVTNIDKEHMDYFKNMDAIKNAFLSFINKVPFYGISILCGDNEHLKELLQYIKRRYLTYGLSEGVDLSARDLKLDGFMTSFDVYLEGEPLGRFSVPLIGEHNVCNALATIAVAVELGLDMEGVRKALNNFSGVQRRFEIKGRVEGINVIDDYGHHPAEIKATLRAARMAIKSQSKNKKNGRLVVLFQPHRYTRTRDLMDEFHQAFTDADKVVIMDIYPAGEDPIPGITSEAIYSGVKENTDAVYIKDRDEILRYLVSELRESDTLITLGAGDVWKMGEKFIEIKTGQNGSK